MRSPFVIRATAAVISLAIPLHAEAQPRKRQALGQGGPMVLRVTPRSFLDPGTVVPVGSLDRTTSGYGQAQSYLLMPPYDPTRAKFGLYLLPSPILNGPYVGATNPFGPVDYVAPRGLAR
ncbi:hypothetical protein [Microvirga massiliensis]|uniref:hypothetical protein n=1 Tax=Microvirga massiliensis TaxID=1033741 RepID=UPI000661270D|nr:hypothetical protein [Microvirga massiliensis]